MQAPSRSRVRRIPSVASLLLATPILSILILPSAALADPLDVGVPIKIFDESALPRFNDLVRLSVPLAEQAAIHKPEELTLLDEAGKEVGVQWRTLSRWRGTPTQLSRPVKFALARFVVDLPAGGTKVYLLRRRLPQDGTPALPRTPIVTEINPTYCNIDTGPILVKVDIHSPALLHEVRLDLDGDGWKSPNVDTVLKKGGTVGSALLDRFGALYLGLLDDASLTVEEAGPQLITLRVDGRHQPLPGVGIGRDFLKWSTRFEFVGGSSSIRVEHVLSNSYLDDPLGGVVFGRALYHLSMAPSGPLLARFGRDDDSGGGVVAVPMTATDEACQVQDSQGGANWQQQAGTTFPGWRVWRRPVSTLLPEQYPASAPLASGDRAAGWLDLSDGQKGVTVAMRSPWRSSPFALRAWPDGSLLLDFWPAEHKGLHWLDDAQRSMHEFHVSFHAGGGDPALEARRLTRPLRPVVPLAFQRWAGAWGDQGDLRDPGLTFAQMQAEGQHELDKRLAIFDENGDYSWHDFGEPFWVMNTHITGSPRNRLTYFDNFVTSGARAWFELSEMFARHSMDLRTYHIDDFEFAEHPKAQLKEGLPSAAYLADMLGRDQLDPALDPHRAGIPPGGHGWNGFDSEHMVVDDVYEYYLLTGSFHAKDALEKIGRAMESWKFIIPTHPVSSSRTVGWPLRALMKIYAVTGDPSLLATAEGIVTSVKTFRGQYPSPQTGLVYHWLARSVYGGGSHNMADDYDMPWQMCVGIYGLALYMRDTGDVSVEPIIREITRYMLDYTLINGVFVEAIDCEDHTLVNPKPSNDGVNRWMASALAISWRLTGDAQAFQMAKAIFDQNQHGFVDSDEQYHWWHTVGEVIGQ